MATDTLPGDASVRKFAQVVSFVEFYSMPSMIYPTGVLTHSPGLIAQRATLGQIGPHAILPQRGFVMGV